MRLFQELWLRINLTLDDITYRDMSYFTDCLYFCLLGTIVVILSPVLVIFAIIFAIWFSFWSLAQFVDWVKDKTLITLFCTLFGMLLGVCANKEGLMIGTIVGFIFGILAEFVKQDCSRNFDINFLDKNPKQQGSPIIVHQVRVVEKPWTWKGFCANEGPKEDNFLRES